MLTTLLQIVAVLLILILIVDYFNSFKICKSLFNRSRKRALDVAESIRNPVADASVALADLENKKKEMVALRSNILTQIAMAKQKATKAKNDVDKFEQLAQKAGAAKNTDDVRLALENKNNAVVELTRADSEVKRLSVQEDQVEVRIKEFESKLTKAKYDAQFLESELQMANFNKEVATALGSGGAAISAIEQLGQDAMRASAQAEAAGIVSNETRSLEDRYSNDGVSDADVAKYMAQ